MQLPFFSSKATTTLVIDSTAIKLLVANGNAVKKWASAPLENGLILEGVIREPEKVGQAVAEFFREEGVSKSNVVTCVPGAHSIHRIFTLPSMRQEDLRNAVIYQAKREMPMPLEELVMAWELLGHSEQHNDVLAIGIPRDIVGVFMETLRYAGIKPKAIDIKPLALARATNRATALIGNVETDSIDIVYLTDYSPVLMRTVYFPDTGDPVTELGGRFADELQRTIRFYNDTNRLKAISPNTPVFLSGGASDYFTLAEALYGSLEYTIERLNPPLALPPDFPIEEYATNIGLALKGK